MGILIQPLIPADGPQRPIATVDPSGPVEHGIGPVPADDASLPGAVLVEPTGPRHDVLGTAHGAGLQVGGVHEIIGAKDHPPTRSKAPSGVPLCPKRPVISPDVSNPEAIAKRSVLLIGYRRYHFDKGCRMLQPQLT